MREVVTAVWVRKVREIWESVLKGDGARKVWGGGEVLRAFGDNTVNKRND